MKIQNLAIIFIIIILPISLVLSYYMQSRVTTLKTQLSYDTRLYNATYDAVKAFQINTLNSDTSNQSNSKMRDLQAAVNSFFNSVQTNFSMNGYSKEILQTHVPALVFTLYDGYYIYSPFNNTLDQATKDKLKDGKAESGYVYDMKPYVYYSCRYKKGGNTDVVITYSLDSYITIKGTVNGTYWDEAGYLLSGANVDSSGKVTYRGVTIEPEQNLKENVVINGDVLNLPYKKVNGVKYYLKDNVVYTVTNGKAEKQSGRTADFVTNNNNAVNYYKEAYEFTQKVAGSVLKDLRASEAVDENGKPISTQNASNANSVKNDTAFYDYSIFKEISNDENHVQIEDLNSDFNAHKMQVIKRSVIRNLSMAIADFNSYSGTTNTFQMPRLSDADWDKLTENIGMISFLQGLNIGGKVYNGYSIVTNNKNKEFVAEDSIYIENGDTYHKALDDDLAGITSGTGYFNIDFERRSAEISQNANGVNSQVTGYYNPRSSLGCYQSIIRQQGSNKSLKELLANNAKLKEIYYTALGRERYSMYRIENANSISTTSSSGSNQEVENPVTPVTVTFSPNTNTTYAKSQSTIVTVTGGSGEQNVLKYRWIQNNTNTPAENLFTSQFTSGQSIAKSDGTGNNWYLWVMVKDKKGNLTFAKSDKFYLDNTAPTNIAPLVTATTTNSVTVGTMQTDAHSGISADTRQYQIKKSSDSNWGTWIIDSNNRHTFTGLELNTDYDIRTQVKDILGNGYTISQTTKTRTANISKPEIRVDNTNWTNQNVTATITYPTGTGVSNQYSYDNSTWQNYTGPLIIDTNKTIYARSVDSTGQGSDASRVVSLSVTNIDKVAPTINIIEVSREVRQQGYIVIEALDDLAGIKSITYDDNKAVYRRAEPNRYYIPTTENKDYVFTAIDNAGNIANVTQAVKNVVESVNGEKIAENPEKYYGRYIFTSSVRDKKWQIFFVDKDNKYGFGNNRIFLKQVYRNYNIQFSSRDLENSKSGYEATLRRNNNFNIYKKMNPSWKAQRNVSINNLNTNELIAALLATKINTTDMPLYGSDAIPAPSLEMYVDSYNQVSHGRGSIQRLEIDFNNANTPGYTYTEYNSLYYGTIDESGYNGMYDAKTDFCSPGARNNAIITKSNNFYYKNMLSSISTTIVVICRSGANVEVIPNTSDLY